MDFEQVARDLEIEKATYVSLLRRFCELTEKDISLLDESLAASDLSGVYSAAHSIKGASASLSLWDIYEAASAICEGAKTESPESIAVLSAAIRKELGLLLSRVADADEGLADDA